MKIEEKAGKETVEKFLNYIGLQYPYKPPKQTLHKTLDPTKILYLADPHEPYGNPEVYKEAFDKHWDAKTVIIGGDLFDFYSQSRFEKTRVQPFRKELRAGFLRLEQLASKFDTILILAGNHDNRSEKTLVNLMQKSPELLEVFGYNILNFICDFFPNVKPVGIELNLIGIEERHKKVLTHIYQHGDIIFTHAERSNANRETLMKNISEYLRKWGAYLGLKSYSVIAQAHNHSDMKTTWGTERWFLTPCASSPYSVGFEYILHPSMKGSPPCVGYSVFHQENGKTDYNRSGNFLI